MNLKRIFNLNEAWITSIERLLVDSGTFILVPSRGESGPLKFNVGGTAEGSITNYSVGWCNKRRCPCLKLHNNDHLVGICYLESPGVFKGRERESNGFMVIRPHDRFLTDWKKLCTLSSFSKITVVDQQLEDFRYVDPLPPQVDWSEYSWNIANKIQRKGLLNTDVAIAIVAWNRPYYFKKVMQTLALNTDIYKYPIFCFFDHCDNVELTEQQVESLYESFPNAIVIKRPRNFGCGRNLIDARRQLFDNMGYDKVFIFEDDMLVSQNYVKLVLEMFRWAESRYSNVASIQAWSECTWDEDKRHAYLNAVEQTYVNLFGYCMSKKAWDTIREDLYTYESLFLGGDYKYRPHKSILKWFKLKLKNNYSQQGGNLFPLMDKVLAAKNNYMNGPPTGQDSATIHLLESRNWVRVCTTVNRGKYIGKKGIHMNEKLWERFGYDKILFKDYVDDRYIDNFVLEKDIKFTESAPIAFPVPGFVYKKNNEFI